MIDIKLIRENPELVKKAAREKNYNVDIDRIIEIDINIREAKTKFQEARTAQKQAGKEISQLDGDAKKDAIARMGALKKEVLEHESNLEKLEPELHQLMLLVPQIPSDEAPRGMNETENVEVRCEGKIPEFDFEIKDHMELGENLDIIDIPRAVKLSGSRNFILKGAGSMLHQAVLRLAMDKMYSKGYQPMTVPVLVNEDIMEGTGYFPVGRDDAYLCERDNQALVGTAEVSLTSYHADEILTEDELPLKYAASSTCFRREAGAAGKDTKGLYRIHYFDKVEQVVLCKNDPEASAQLHVEILKNAEECLQEMGLPYRLIEVCTGDMGQGKVRMFDIETWMPSRGCYSETHSASCFHDFQARRLNIRYKDSDGNIQYVHTLNNTVIASPRILIPLMEINQNADGSISIPEALQQYMGGMTRIEVAK